MSFPNRLGDTGLNVVLENHLADFAECRLDCSYLKKYGRAIAIFLNHLGNSAYMSLHLCQTFQNFLAFLMNTQNIPSRGRGRMGI